MKYKIRKLSNFKRRQIFDTYEPKKRIRINRENTLPWVVRAGHNFSFLGGMIGFWASGILIGIKGFFHAESKMKNFSLNKKMIEFRIKK
ncbi:MAG: hypothetical protein WCX73_00460 [Candidatus Pacearchaeota archaeon]|jgi:hypothetical protein